MGNEIRQLDRIVEPMRERIERYAALVQEIAAEKAQSLTLFGAIAAGTFDATRHAVRNVLVLDRVDLGLLRRLAEHGVKLGKARISAPLIMTEDYIRGSLDTFPLELIEIQQKHVTILGDDPFSDLTFQDEHVRLQCERESKSLLIGLRQGLLAAAGSDKVLKAVELEMSDALMRTMRGMVWLQGSKGAIPAIEVVAAIEKQTKRKMPGIRASLDPSADHDWRQFEALYADVEALAESANA